MLIVALFVLLLSIISVITISENINFVFVFRVKVLEIFWMK